MSAASGQDRPEQLEALRSVIRRARASAAERGDAAVHIRVPETTLTFLVSLPEDFEAVVADNADPEGRVEWGTAVWEALAGHLESQGGTVSAWVAEQLSEAFWNAWEGQDQALVEVDGCGRAVSGTASTPVLPLDGADLIPRSAAAERARADADDLAIRLTLDLVRPELNPMDPACEGLVLCYAEVDGSMSTVVCEGGVWRYDR